MNYLSAEKLYGKKFGGAIFSAVMLLYVFVNFAGGLILSFAGATAGDTVYIAVSALFSIVAILIVLLFVKIRRDEQFFSTVNLKKFSPVFILCSVLLSVGMFCGFGFINVAVTSFIESLGGKVSNPEIIIESPLALIMFLVLYALLPALFEEFLFRGLILSATGKNIIAALVSGLLFAFFHCNLGQFVYQFIYGFALAILTLKSGSVLPSVISHFINNAAVIFFLYFGVDVPLYNPILIVCGLAISALFIVLILSMRVESKKDNGGSFGGFFLFAGLGIAVCVLLMIAGLFKL